MSWLPLLPLLGVWILVVMSPGPDFLIVLRYSAAGSRRSGVRAAAGVVTGIGVWAVAGLFGVTVLVQRFEWLYTAARVAGALFLVAFGVATIRAARRQASPADDDAAPALAAHRPGRLREWRAGLLTNLANPKALVFFGALFASLLPHRTDLVMRAVTLGAMLAIAFAWFSAVAFLAGSPWITRGYRRLRKRLDMLTGGLFVGMGALLIPR
ncbi:LysE family transporter [Microbispora sp. NPDC046933]|uniref:LysE family translocator n=1 Tax=Microbispora sp. NPDC046933 TaxID=3155618 RepID=UPI0033C58584